MINAETEKYLNYHGKVSRQQIGDVLLTFPRKWNLKFGDNLHEMSNPVF